MYPLQLVQWNYKIFDATKLQLFLVYIGHDFLIMTSSIAFIFVIFTLVEKSLHVFFLCSNHICNLGQFSLIADGKHIFVLDLFVMFIMMENLHHYGWKWWMKVTHHFHPMMWIFCHIEYEKYRWKFRRKNWMENFNENGWFNNVWDENVNEHSYEK